MKQASITIVAALLLCIGPPISAADHLATGATGRLIVQYQDSAAKLPPVALGTFYQKRRAMRQRAGLTLRREMSGARELLSPDTELSHREVVALARRLSSQPGIVSASPEYWRQPMLEPNDPLFQRGASPADQSYLYNGDYSLLAPGAWDTTVGSSSVVIAVIDTGYLPTHPELQNRSVAGIGYDFVSADAPGDFTSANDGDGRDNDPTDPGDRCGDSQVPSSWHGTGVASAAAGSSNDGIGMTGIDWSARLLHVRALGECGGTDADIIDALRWSAGLDVIGVERNPYPASVINVSLGGPTECTLAWQQAIDEVTAQGVSIVMAAGNTGDNALRNSPSNCSNVVSVGSSTPGGSLDSGFSNFGLKTAIAAPGRNIVIATNSGFDAADADGNEYTGETGTSFSSALISGAIGLIKSVNPELTPAQIVTLLQDSATAFAPGSCDDYYCGGGIANLAAAVELATRFSDPVSQSRELAIVTGAATPLPLDVDTAATLGGFRDMQYFAVEIDRPGLLSVSSDADATLYGYLLDPTLSARAIDEQGSGGLDFLLSARVEPGTYYVAVERSVHSARNDANTPFSLLATLSDDMPDSFAFDPVTGAAPSSTIASAQVTIAGLSAPVPVLVSGGSFSLNGAAARTEPATIANGDTLRLLVHSAEQPLAMSSAIVDVGAYRTRFDVTTRTPGGSGGGAGGCSIAQGAKAFDPMLALLAALALPAVLRRPRRRIDTPAR